MTSLGNQILRHFGAKLPANLDLIEGEQLTLRINGDEARYDFERYTYLVEYLITLKGLWEAE